jgi:hypothetical protein
MESGKETQVGIRDPGSGIQEGSGAQAIAPHSVNVAVWDIPSAIVAGERFTMKVGIKCAEGCDLPNADVAIFDEEGSQIGTATVAGDVWPGTTGLHVTEVELTAPSTEGLYRWSANVPSTSLGTSPASEAEIPHAEGSASFGIRVVGHPEYVVRVEAVDTTSQTPLAGARVVMHPYRAVTDERGIAQVRVAKGAYKLFVSQTRYITFGVSLDVTSDVTTRAELEVEPVLERN